MPRTTPSRIRRLRAMVSSSTAPGAKAIAVAACTDGLKPVPTNLSEENFPEWLPAAANGNPERSELADGDSCERLEIAEKGSPNGSRRFVGRGFSRDISS